MALKYLFFILFSFFSLEGFDDLTLENIKVNFEYRVKLKEVGILDYLPEESASPLVDSDLYLVYAFSKGKKVALIDDLSGRVIWEVKTYGEFTNSPLISGRYLFVSNMNGDVYKIDRFTGKILFNFETENSVFSDMEQSDDLLFVCDVGDKVYALSKKSGKVVWTYKRKLPFKFTILADSGFLKYKDRLIKGFSDGTVVFFNQKDGKVLKEISLTSGKTVEFSDISETPVLYKGKVFAISYMNGYAFIDPESMEKVSFVKLSKLSSPFIYKNRLYAIRSGNKLVLIKEKSFKVVHEYKGFEIKNALCVNDNVFFTTGKSLISIDPETGGIRFKISLFYGISAKPVIVFPYIYFISDSGYLYRVEVLN